MGALHARELAEMDTDTLEGAIEWHLTANHFPPIPRSMVRPCIEAIEAGRAYDWHKLIRLPDGVGYQGRTAAPASAIIEAHHLTAWLEVEE